MAAAAAPARSRLRCGSQDSRDEVAECQPYDVADHPQRAGADIFAVEIFVARYGLVTERHQRIGGVWSAPTLLALITSLVPGGEESPILTGRCRQNRRGFP